MMNSKTQSTKPTAVVGIRVLDATSTDLRCTAK
jgi:hypothetical protein